MKNTAAVLIGVLVLVALGVLSRGLVSGPASIENASSIDIGAALGLSGACANWGEGEQRAIELAINEANRSGGIQGKQLRIVAENTQCDARNTVNAIQKLIDIDHVAAIIGPTWGDSFQAGYPIIDKAGIVTISPSAAFEALRYNEQPYAYAFSTWFPEKGDVDASAQFAQTHKDTRIVILHDEDTFGATMADLFTKEAPSFGLQIIKTYKFPIGYNDFRTNIEELKTLKPDAVFVSFQGPQPKAQFMKQAHELGFNVQVFSSTDIEDASLLQEFGSVLDGVVYGSPQPSGAYDAFAQKYKDTYGTAPEGPAAANAYDATRALIVALSDHYKNGAGLRSALQDTVIPGTVAKEIRFDSNHQLTGTTFVAKTIRNGEFVPVTQ